MCLREASNAMPRIEKSTKLDARKPHEPCRDKIVSGPVTLYYTHAIGYDNSEEKLRNKGNLTQRWIKKETI